MFERLSYLYSIGKLTVEQIDAAVSKGWITAEQKTEIIVE
ncbi:MAG: XkdX family protein [Ruminiclostridium sp.]